MPPWFRWIRCNKCRPWIRTWRWLWTLTWRWACKWTHIWLVTAPKWCRLYQCTSPACTWATPTSIWTCWFLRDLKPRSEVSSRTTSSSYRWCSTASCRRRIHFTSRTLRASIMGGRSQRMPASGSAGKSTTSSLRWSQPRSSRSSCLACSFPSMETWLTRGKCLRPKEESSMIRLTLILIS